MITLLDIKNQLSIIGDRCHKLLKPPLIAMDMRAPCDLNGGHVFVAKTIDIPDDGSAAAELVLDHMKMDGTNTVAFYQLYSVGNQLKLRFGSFKH